MNEWHPASLEREDACDFTVLQEVTGAVWQIVFLRGEGNPTGPEGEGAGGAAGGGNKGN